MAINDYSTLRTAVAQYLHRQDLNANIPDFIAMAEWRAARSLRVSQLLKDLAVPVFLGEAIATLPADFMQLVNLRISNGRELQYVPPDCIDRLSGAGVPWAYTITGSTILVAPSWTTGGALDLRYWAKPEGLSDTATTNWYVQNAPDVLLYGALLEASPFIEEDPRIPVWQQFFDRSIAAVNSQYGNVDPHKRALAYQQPDRNPSSDLRNIA
jgi:hypothetical protein